jgi:hypothetical protein
VIGILAVSVVASLWAGRNDSAKTTPVNTLQLEPPLPANGPVVHQPGSMVT